MRKKSFILVVLFSLFFIPDSFSQVKDPAKLPDDPRVKTGTLANGLSYIIIKNQAQKGLADFCVAQKVGTVLENSGREGSFKLLELLATKGTRNFEGSTILSYLQSLGVKGNDISFNTGKDETTYLIKNIPVGRPNTIDSSLLILYNWMSSINVDEDDLEKERPILVNMALNNWDASSRLDNQEIKNVFPDSPYGRELNPSNIKSVKNLSSKDLRTFYYNWCRPDLQCVIVVGDVDPAKLETQIKSAFATIPKPLKPETRDYYIPKKFAGVKAVLLKDAEYDKTTVSISFLKEPLLEKYKTTNIPYIQEYMDNAITSLLQDRIREGIVQQSLPIFNVNISTGKFMGVEKSSAYTISFETLPNTVYASLAFISGEIDKMGKFGFNNQEFNKSVEIYWRRLENFYDNRASAPNDVYLNRALDNFYGGYSLASTELKFAIMKQVLFSLNLSDLNGYAKALLDQNDNIVIACRMPDVKGIEQLSKERVLASYTESLGKGPSEYKNAPILKWPDVVPTVAANIISDTEDPITGAYVLTLSNGATIVLKHTTDSKDTIAFKAVSKGGFSLMSGVNSGNEDFINGVLNLGGLGNISQANMQRLYDYNHMNVFAKILQNTEEINGYGIAANAEKLFQALNLSMTSRRKDNAAFDIYKQKMVYNTMYHSLSPERTFADTVNYYQNSNKNFVAPITAEQINGYDYTDMLNNLNQRFSNAADFTFIFAGNFDVQAFKDYAVKYIGSIPGDATEKENAIVVPNYFAKGVVNKRFLFKMDVPRTYVNFTLSCGAEFNIRNEILGEMTQTLLEDTYRGELRHFSTNYKITTDLKDYPENIFVASSYFETDSTSATELEYAIVKKLDGVSNGGISDAQFKELANEVADKFNSNNRGNSYWLTTLERRYILGKDFYNNFSNELSGISKSEFSKFIAGLLSGNRISVIMDGTTHDVETEKLLKEDTFIKDYFDVN
jgi:zinc protease